MVERIERMHEHLRARREQLEGADLQLGAGVGVGDERIGNSWSGGGKAPSVREMRPPSVMSLA